MTRIQCSTHERFNTIAYAKIQRRLRFITKLNINNNFNSNVDSNSYFDLHSNLDFNVSNSNFIFAQFVFTSFFMRITTFDKRLLNEKRLFDEKWLFDDKRLFDDKKMSRKIYKIKKTRKIIYSIIKFYDSFYDNFFSIL